jgi:hypothetical protein
MGIFLARGNIARAHIGSGTEIAGVQDTKRNLKGPDDGAYIHLLHKGSHFPLCWILEVSMHVMLVEQRNFLLSLVPT